MVDDSYFMYVDNNKTAALGAFLLLLFARAKNETPGEKYVFDIWAACMPPQKDSSVVPMWHLWKHWSIAEWKLKIHQLQAEI